MAVREALYRTYWKLRGAIAPTLRYSQDLYEETLKAHIKPEMQWLDLGCGHQVLPAWRFEQEKQIVQGCKMVVGFDYDFPSLKNHRTISLKVRGDITKLPFKDTSLDLVTANMVVEHLDAPDVQFREVWRILKPGGIFIFHTPNAYGYTTIMGRLTPEALKSRVIKLFEARKEEDVFRTYHRANTRKTIHGLAVANGFEVVKIRMLVTDAVFVIIPPLVALELVWIKLLMAKAFEPLRTNIIAILKKQ